MVEKDIEVVVLHFGSAGSSQAASMILVRRGGDTCSTKSAAIRSVAKFFYGKWAKDNGPPPRPKKCCGTTKAKPGEAQFCGKCARSLVDPLFDHESYTDWLLQQPSHTASDWGSYEGDWWPWNTLALISHHWKEGVGCMEVSASSEKMLTWALDREAKWIPEAYKSTISELQAQELEGKDSLDINGLIEENTKTFDELIEQRLGAAH